MRRAIRSQLARLGQRPRVAQVGLHLAAPRCVHGGEVRVRHHHLVAQLLQATRHPLALGRRLDQDPRPRPLSQYSGEPLPLRSDPPLHHLPALRQDADLAFHLVYVDAKMLHGWPPPLRHTTACTTVGLRPPRAVAASRFIPSFASPIQFVF
jgi:hypothetical protein